GGRGMTAARAIEILTPGRTRYSPAEYEKALELAREALRYWMANSMAPALLDMREREAKP
ncbi:MAG: hypothetical protein IIZ83_06590, partial [Oscillospiraceae bacterium]|nr:hypothetical protein [Oscillospiraceae bacterium]